MLKKIMFLSMIIATLIAVQSCKVASPFITGAKINIQINDYQAAKRDLGKEIERDSTSVEAHYLMGYIWNDEENYEQMQKSFAKVKSLDPNYEKANIDNMSIKAFGNLRKSGINDRYNPAVMIINSNPEKAKASLQAGLKDLLLADKIKNDDFITKYIIGNIYLQLADEEHKNYKDKAIEIFNECIKIADIENDKANLVGLYINLANIYTERNDEVKTLEYLNEILKFDPVNKEAIIKIAAYYRDKDNFEEALKMYNQLIEIDPNNADVLFNQGIAFKKMKRLDDAISNFEKIVELNPNDNEAKIFLGRFYFEAEKWQKVVDILDVNFESFTGKEKIDAADYLTRVLPKLGRAKEAQKYMEYLK
ncbi:MAG: tetratricopeptide repeat protein [Candidatus Delongbacteria bacterium]|nr:tetratricopeptide repeat protein [Candidatus Delongbacteria bacterium]